MLILGLGFGLICPDIFKRDLRILHLHFRVMNETQLLSILTVNFNKDNNFYTRYESEIIVNGIACYSCTHSCLKGAHCLASALGDRSKICCINRR